LFPKLCQSTNVSQHLGVIWVTVKSNNNFQSVCSGCKKLNNTLISMFFQAHTMTSVNESSISHFFIYLTIIFKNSGISSIYIFFKSQIFQSCCLQTKDQYIPSLQIKDSQNNIHVSTFPIFIRTFDKKERKILKFSQNKRSKRQV